MQLVLGLLFVGVHLVCAGTHSLKYFYTGVSGVSNLPELTVVGLVDDQQFIYFDSITNRTVPKTEWIKQNEGADYWNSETQTDNVYHQNFKNNIQVAKERFNQTTGVHTFQQMYGCEFDDQTGETNGFQQYGYYGEDFLSLDLKEIRWVSPVQQGFITVQKWNKNTALLERDKNYFSFECIGWLQKYLEYGKSSLKKTVSPQVSLLQRSSRSPVLCHATGFYPKEVTISWMKNGQDHDEDVEVGETLPNEDGTFQKTSTITVTPEEWKNNKFICVVEHQGETMRVNEIRTNTNQTGDSVPIGIIIGVVAAVLLLIVIGVVGYKVYQKRTGFRPVNASADGSNRSTHSIDSVHSDHSHDSIDSVHSVHSDDQLI